MKILSVVGARPQFVKLAAIDHAIGKNDEHIIIHTGQHYDSGMSDVFFEDLDIKKPDVNLHVGSKGHGAQTGQMLEAIEEQLLKYEPDIVLVYGDTNSTLAAAVAAIKIHMPIAHLEAGLRSFNRRMPEEHNRVLTDHAADLLLAPTETAMSHLKDENIGNKSILVGDVMTDILFETLKKENISLDLDNKNRQGHYIATIHRPDNTDDADRLQAIIDAFKKVPHTVHLVAHPRLVDSAKKHGISLEDENIVLKEPLAYPDLMRQVSQAEGVITDSGGLQKEAFLLRTPCTTIRPETEWVETVKLGWNVLVDKNLGELTAVVARSCPKATDAAPYGDGTTAEKVVKALKENFAKRD